MATPEAEAFQLLTAARTAEGFAGKKNSLQRLQELIIQHESVQSKYLPEVLLFERDSSALMRTWLISFIENVSKTRSGALLVNELSTLHRLVGDASHRVVKEAIRITTILFRSTLLHVCRTSVSEATQAILVTLQHLQKAIVALAVSAQRDGVRVQALKFMEIAAFCYSSAPPNAALAQSDSFHIGMVPFDHALLDPSAMEKEGKSLVMSLIARFKDRITCSNAVLIIDSLVAIARRRPAFIVSIVRALVDLPTQPPPALSHAQFNCVKHMLRTRMVAILDVQVPQVVEVSGDIQDCLTNELGAEPDKVLERMRWVQAEKRRLRATGEASRPRSAPVQIAYDVQEVLSLLPPQHVMVPSLIANLVIHFMDNLPEDPPESFGSTTDERVDAKSMGEIALFKPELVALPIAPEQCEKLTLLSFRRILKAEQSAAQSGKARLRHAYVAKLVADQPLRGAIVQLLLGHVSEKFEERMDLSLTWLTYEWMQEQYNNQAADDEENHRYAILLLQLLQMVKDGVDAKDLSLTQFLVSLPEVTLEALQLIEEFCEDASSITLGLSVLRDVMLARPSSAEQCLQSVLRFCTHIKEFVRHHSIRLTANILFLQSQFTVAIETYAVEQLNKVLEAPPEELFANVESDVIKEMQESEEAKEEAIQGNEEEKEGEADVEMTDAETKEKEEKQRVEEEAKAKAKEDACKTRRGELTEQWIKSHVLLFFALCTKRPQLLEHLVGIYPNISNTVRPVVHRQLSNLVQTIGMDSKPLLAVIKSCVPGTENLVLQILHTLTAGKKSGKKPEGKKPSKALTKTVKELFEKMPDARLFIPVLGGLHKDEIRKHLPALVKMSDRIVENVIDRLSHVGAPHFSPINATELLVMLHWIRGDDQNVWKAIKYCMGQSAVFTQDVMAVTMQRVVATHRLPPPIFLRTVIYSLQLRRFRDLMHFVLKNILTELVKLKVWEDKLLWEGFVKCCQGTLPYSCEVLVKLPKRQLDELLDGQETTLNMMTHLTKRYGRQRHAVRREIAEVLEHARTRYRSTQSSRQGPPFKRQRG